MAKGGFLKMEGTKTTNDEELTITKEVLDDLPFYVASDILRQQRKAYKVVTEGDQDRVYVIAGRERSGKSTLAQQLAFTVDKNFSLDNICFTPKQFAERVRRAKKFESLIYDEAFFGLSSKGSISKENRNLVKIFMECGFKNLFIFVCLPSFFLLEKYIAISRSQALFNVFVSKRNFKLRYYKVYNYKQKTELYLRGKAMMSFNRPKITKSYRFYGKLPPNIIKSEYDAKKLAAFREDDGDKPEETKHLKQRTVFSRYLREKYDFNYVEQRKLLEKYDCGVADTVLSRFAKHTPSKIHNT